MKVEKIKPIPKYILRLIRKEDLHCYPAQDRHRRFYAYLTKNDGELVKVTVCCINTKGNWHCKQVAVHGIDSNECFVKDMVFHYISGYNVGWYFEGLQKTKSWYESKDWGYSEDRWFDPFAFVVNREIALKEKEFKYSAINLYNGQDIFKYLRLYRKYPQMEYLVKLGLQHLCMSKQILELCGKDKGFRKYLGNNARYLNSPRSFYIASIIKAYTTNTPIDVVDRREKMLQDLYRAHCYQDLKALFKGNMNSLVDYMYELDGVNYQTYADYIKACKALNIDLSEEKNLFPKDFRRWHDIRIDEYKTLKQEEDEKLRKDFYKHFADIASKYASLETQNQAFVVVIAKSPKELIKEGDTLHHCVGRMGYDQKFAREESLIFFIRHIDDINTPFVTVEYSLKRKQLLQCYGENNHRPSEDVLEYLNKKWLPYTKKQLKKIA